MSKDAILLVYSDNNLGDLAIVLSRIQKLNNKSITLFSVYNKYQKKFVTEHVKLLKYYKVYSNPYGELGLDISNKFFSDLIKVMHCLILPFIYFYHRFIIRFNLNTSIFINKIKRNDNFYLKGGSIFESYGSKRELISLMRIWLLLSLIKKTKKKIIFDPQSFGPFKSSSSSLIFKKIAEIPELIYCREKVSYRYLRLFFKLKNIELKSDIVFDYKTTIKSKSDFEEAIGLTLVASSLNRDIYISNIKRLILLYTKFLKISKVKIIRQVDLNDFDDSEEKMESILIKDKDLSEIRFEIIKDLNSLDDAFRIYKSLHFLIGTRLHSTIFSSLTQTPFINIEYQGFKSRGTYELFNLSNRVFTLKNIDKLFNEKKHKELELLINPEDLKSAINSKVKFYN